MAASLKNNMSGSRKDPEDWFYESIRLYDQLHMFDLSNPVTALCWIGQDRLCVAGERAEGKGELLELSIPSKLLAKDEGLVKDRDFDQLSGASCEKTIRNVVQAKNRVVVTSEDGENLIKLWNLPDESTGSIKHVSTIHNSSPEDQHASIGITSGGDGPVIFGSRMSNINLMDIETSQITSSEKCRDSGLNDDLCDIQCVSEHVFVCCSRHTGALGVCDLREGLNKLITHDWPYIHRLDSPLVWSFDTKEPGAILRASSEGHVYLSDLSDPRRAIRQASISRDSGNRNCLEAKFCPNKSMVSIADDSGLLRLFDTDRWDACNSERTASLCPEGASFCHEGHLVNSDQEKVQISTHTWHPTLDDLILSAATDGSLHAWCYNKSHLQR